MKIAEIIKTEREQKGMTQDELAKKVGITRDSISLWEMGKRIPGTQYLIPLCDAFEISTDYLLGRTDDFGAAVPAEQNLSQDEREVLALYGSLSPARKEDLLIFLRALSGTSSSAVSKKKA